MALCIAFFVPFIAAALAVLITRLFKPWAGWVLALFPAGLAVWFGAQVPASVQGEVLSLTLPWMPDLGIDFALRLDGLSLLMALLITGLGTLVVIYAGRYLVHHEVLGRFYGWLLLFMGGMLGIVLADNTLLLFVCWEVTTFSSFILIGFEHKEDAARESAQRALLITALGGQSLLVGLLLMGDVVGTLSISGTIAASDTVRDSPRYLAILLLVLGGAFTKSAQMPFHTWLPGAMTAPTPVSAYLHSATMVKAGVFLLARLSPVLGGTPPWETILTIVGTMTMVLGALLALGHTDLKLVLAYATVSVLGALVMLLGQGTAASIQAMVTFLTAHALYKGTLFLVAGSVDHETGTRDVAHLSGLRKRMPMTAAASAAASLSMMGLPPLFGFVGKELIYEACLEGPGGWPLAMGATVGFGGMVAAALRVGVQPFAGKTFRASKPESKVHEAPPSMWMGPALLGAAGLMLGLVPWAIQPLLAMAAVDIGGSQAGGLELSLWHGVTPALGLSVGSLVIGGSLFALRQPVLKGLRALNLSNHGPERFYQASLSGLLKLSSSMTRVLQNGSLHQYIVVTLATFGGLLALAVFLRLGEWPRGVSKYVLSHEVVVLVGILAAAVLAVVSRSALTSILALGALGLAEALLYVFFGAPDLAMTQIVVQTLTVILFALVFSRFPVQPHEHRFRWWTAALPLAVGGLITWIILHVASTPSHTRLADFYATQSVPAGKGLNIVNVILVDFRAFDTLGEATVLATSGLGVYLLFRTRSQRKKRQV
ncbi:MULTISPECIES: hydrogen gas-evolving membrane-bound hydrogenase subunit E [Myxococcus]|uniref:hydrogen gas-evolving membrane-bound hydrogenase subunit E n=1 Tax=Myxococcus TaxID=32 RepID=UPI0004781377|nr:MULTISPECIES: hydrogen gas-evolving membrane-bound hydrogenase subunit E [Myxococcus]UYI11295.1 proton-conducting transporter membrane subunit [Myxococcus xanthus]UYI18665.1 proton-conducting transporter membrane subunit [Myxococcus xanthus]